MVKREYDINTIESTWEFKLKRFIYELIKRFQYRLCANGDKHLEEVDLLKTYAPIVQWTTICIMLILEVMLGLKHKQGYVNMAFLH